MTLLIVDDNRYVVEGLKAQLADKDYGIDTVLGCYSVQEAKNIFRNQSVELLITDIEMPGSSGFDLLQWLHNECLNPITVLLTGYAEFSYAQRSVEYGVTSYLLKPLDDNALEQAIRQMLERFQKQKQDTHRMNCGDKWLMQQNRVRADFWQSALRLLQSGDTAALQKHLANKPACICSDAEYLAVKVEIVSGGTPWRPELITYACENVLTELMQNSDADYESLVYAGGDTYILMLRKQLKAGQTDADSVLEILRSFFRSNLDIALSIVDKKPFSLDCLADAPVPVQLLGNVEPVESALPRLRYTQPDMEGWKQLILSGELDTLEKSIRDVLAQNSGTPEELAEYLGAFQIDWNLMIHGILKENSNLTVTELRKTGFSQWMTNDPGKLTRLAMEDASRITELLDTDNFSRLNVARIRNYIRENMADVTRSSIAEHFYFSPNYLSKLFRNVEGISLITYIQNQRMERAKELLVTTDLSISEIAMEIGYPNFSHFSKRFRDFIGCSPNEYRRKARSSTKKKGT